MTSSEVVASVAGESESKSPFRWVHPGNAILRRAIRDNLVSFPSQVPTLSKSPRPDMQWRAVLLYLVRNWPLSKIAARYQAPEWRIAQIVHDWSVRAFAAGHIQVIDSGRFAELSGQRPPLAAVATAHREQPRVRAATSAGVTSAAIAAGIPPDARNGVLDALDGAIRRCAALDGEFWSQTCAELRSLRLAVEAMERAGGAVSKAAAASLFGGAA